jgi:hypothetical protein
MNAAELIKQRSANTLTHQSAVAPIHQSVGEAQVAVNLQPAGKKNRNSKSAGKVRVNTYLTEPTYDKLRAMIATQYRELGSKSMSSFIELAVLERLQGYAG